MKKLPLIAKCIVPCIILTTLFSCKNKPSTEETESKKIQKILEAKENAITDYVQSLSTEAKISQLFLFDSAFIKKLIIVALPVLLSESCWGLGITSQNSIFAHAGTDSFSAYSIMNTISQLTWVVFIGMGNAASVILGKKIGAGEESTAKAFAHKYAWFFPLMGFFIGLFLFPLSLLLPYLFNVSPEIIAITQSMIYVLIALYPFRAFNILIIIGICRSGGDTIFASLIDNGWMWVLAIPLGCLACFVWQLPAWIIFLCLESEQIFKTLCGIWRLKSGKWLKNITK